MKELNIAGLAPFSTVDWPGKLVATVFLQGCPWRCPYCHNAEILDSRTKGAVSWSEVVDLLDARRGLLDGVVFSGGEALMQASSGALERGFRQVKERGYLTGLHAGGAYPSALERLLDRGLIDWVGLDVKALPEDYLVATARDGGDKAEQSLAVLVRHPEVDHEVRLTLWPGLAPNSDLLPYALRVAKWAAARGARNFALQRYRQPPGTEGTPEVAWDEDVARAALTDIGFATSVVR